MVDREVQDAWRLYQINWMPLLAMAFALFAALLVTAFSLKIESLLLQGLGLAWLLLAAGHAAWRMGYPRLALACVSSAQLELVYLLSIPLSYVAAAADLPLQDANLAWLTGCWGWTGRLTIISSARGRLCALPLFDLCGDQPADVRRAHSAWMERGIMHACSSSCWPAP